MSTIINTVQIWLNNHPKVKQWGWFVLLWFAGLITVSTLTYPIKLLMKTI